MIKLSSEVWAESNQPSCSSSAVASWLPSLHGADLSIGAVRASGGPEEVQEVWSLDRKSGAARGGCEWETDRPWVSEVSIIPFRAYSHDQGSTQSLVKVLSTVGTVHPERTVRLQPDHCSDELHMPWWFWDRKSPADNIPGVCTTKISW